MTGNVQLRTNKDLFLSGTIKLPRQLIWAMLAMCPECEAEAVHPVLNFPGHREQRCLNARCGAQWRLDA